MVIEPRFRRAGKFSEGLAYVEAEGLAGFINRRGEIVIKLKADGAPEFHDGLAAVNVDQGWGFHRPLRNARAVVTHASGRLLKTRRGYIDRSGKYIWEPQ